MTIARVQVLGLEGVNLATALLQRVRMVGPTFGIWEAADVQWWWRRPRASDDVQQTFWVDAHGPIAAALLTDWDSSWQLDAIALPDAAANLLPDVWENALERVSRLGLNDVEVLAPDDDELMRGLLADAGFSAGQELGGVTWLAASRAPAAAALPDGYRFIDRSVTSSTHWLAPRNGREVEARLHQCSLYDPELDMAVQTADGTIASYALFWFDPVTTVGMIEPIRTEDDHRRLGLASGLM